MELGGWILMITSWTAISLLAAYCLHRVWSSDRDS